MDERAQTSFEYILLLAGVILGIAIVYMMLRQGPLTFGESEVNRTIIDYNNATNISDYV